MTKNELIEIIKVGENVSVEFKLEEINNKRLAKEICGLCNAKGGFILLGVDDFGEIVGCNRPDNEERVMNICCDSIEPKLFPAYYECIIDKKKIVIIRLLETNDKPYAIKKNNSYSYYIRIGTTCREAGRNELLRLFQKSSFLPYEILERKDATIKNIDLNRFKEYLRRLYIEVDEKDLYQVMINKKFMRKNNIPTLAGLALFGKDIKSICPMLKVDIVKFDTDEIDYHIVNQRTFYGALLNNYDENSDIAQLGLIDKCLDYIKVNLKMSVKFQYASRQTSFEYPLESIRELLVNCLAHRDYTIEGEGVRVFIYNNRLEFISPGGLPNSIDLDSLRESLKYGVVPTYARNPVIVEVLKQFGYIENIGMGIYKKVYVLMNQLNQTTPLLEDTGRLFKVTLFNGINNASHQSESLDGQK
jgi:ATP-dependent DNA helicase RecG